MKRYHDESMIARLERKKARSYALAWGTTLLATLAILAGIWLREQRATDTGIFLLFFALPAWLVFAANHDNLEGVRR